MTQESLDVLEKLSGWTEKSKYERISRVGYPDLDTDGVMWMWEALGTKLRRLEHMDIEGKIFVRDPQ
jgi:hypothetical protein